MYRLIRRTHNGIDLVLKYIDEHIRSEGLRDMHENAETISSVRTSALLKFWLEKKQLEK